MYEHQIVNIDDLIPYALNSRTHSEQQVAQIAASIREFGFTNPVLIDDQNNLIAGHGRVLAARKLKMQDIPAIIVTGLDERKRRALIIADNKLALNAGWDESALRVELITIGSMSLVCMAGKRARGTYGQPTGSKQRFLSLISPVATASIQP